MRCTFAQVLVLLLLVAGLRVHAEPEDGRVAFDAPNLPPAEFQFDLDKRVIGLVMEDPTSKLAPLFGEVDALYLRSYRFGVVNLKEVVLYYGETLKPRGWQKFGAVNVRVHTLQTDQTDGSVKGIFVIAKSGGNVYLINIVGEIPENQVIEVLVNLHQLGIEIPELMSLRRQGLKPEQPSPEPPPEPEIVVPTPEPQVPEEDVDSPPPPVEPSPQWHYDGEPIHGLQVQARREADIARVMKILDNGSGDIVNVMPILASMFKGSRRVSLRIDEKDSQLIAVIEIVGGQVTEQVPATVTLLEKLTISAAGVHKSVQQWTPGPDESVLGEVEGGTRFRAGDMPISEIHIQGNLKVPETEIQQVLGNGSEDIEEALKTLFEVLPYFQELRLEVVEAEDSRYIATLTVTEKPLSTDVYAGLKPLVRFGFNRVTGWEIGSGLEVGKRKGLGPLWAWNVPNSVADQTSKLFGRVSYAFGNPRVQYRGGATANWGDPYMWNLGVTAQAYRLADVVAPDIFPNYESGVFVFQRVIGIPDFPNYYLRQGAEIAVRWAPILPMHTFKLAAVTESQTSLQKSTDWFVVNWGSSLAVRENPPITEGRMRSLTFRYDFQDRTGSLGWHNTFFLEHSNAAVGSDFDFTRFRMHFRYSFPLQSNRIRTRFVFGYSNATLPVQRQFVISGIDGLRGYAWQEQADESEGFIAYKSGHTASPYVFAGDRGFLLNIEYHYALSNLLKWGFFKNVFAVLFFDEGQVWNVSDSAYTFDPRGNIGIGLQFGEETAIFRVNVARAFESGRGIQVTTAWHQSF